MNHSMLTGVDKHAEIIFCADGHRPETIRWRGDLGLTMSNGGNVSSVLVLVSW